MTLSSLTNKKEHTADGVQDTFVYDFLIYDASEMAVYEDGVLTTLGYTVSGVGNNSGGNVVFTSTVPSSGTIVTLIREAPYTQTTDYTEYDPFPAETHEKGLDRGVMLVQQVKELVTRCARFPIGYAHDESKTEIIPVAGKAIGFNQTLDGFTTVADLTQSVSSFWEGIFGTTSAQQALVNFGWLDLVNAWTKQNYMSKSTLSIVSGEVDIDMDDNPECELTVDENVTINDFSNKAHGKCVSLKVIESGGGHTITWNTNIDFAAGPSAHNNIDGAVTWYRFWTDGTKIYAVKEWEDD